MCRFLAEIFLAGIIGKSARNVERRAFPAPPRATISRKNQIGTI
jgi:hypothetical protein